MRKGPLTSIRIVEFAGIGPVPYGTMILADLGAQIIRIDRPSGYPAVAEDLDFDNMEAASVCNRSRRLVRVDLKKPEGRDLVLRLAAAADGLIEGYRPGTMERLGLGPDACLAVNPRLAYVRTTGWGQTGPMASMAGHDLNYVAMSGVLSLFGRDGQAIRGVPPLMGDMAGGGLFTAIGILAALIEARSSGRGQVVDAAIVDGAASLAALVMGIDAASRRDPAAGPNLFDGSRHYYRTYRCSDGGAVSVGAIEPAFRRVLLERLGLAADPDFTEPSAAGEAKRHARLEAIFAGRPRDHWTALFADGDGCVAPVLGLDEAAACALNRARENFVRIDGVLQPAPAPRFSRTPGAISVSPREASRPDAGALVDWGLDTEEIAALESAGVIG